MRVIPLFFLFVLVGLHPPCEPAFAGKPQLPPDAAAATPATGRMPAGQAAVPAAGRVLLIYYRAANDESQRFEQDYRTNAAFREEFLRRYEIETRQALSSMEAPVFAVPSKNLQVRGYGGPETLLRQLGFERLSRPPASEQTAGTYVSGCACKPRLDRLDKQVAQLNSQLTQITAAGQNAIKRLEQIETWIKNDRSAAAFEDVDNQVAKLRAQIDALNQSLAATGDQQSQLDHKVESLFATWNHEWPSSEGRFQNLQSFVAEVNGRVEQLERLERPETEPFRFVFEMVDTNGKILRQVVDEPGEVVRIRQVPVSVKGE